MKCLQLWKKGVKGRQPLLAVVLVRKGICFQRRLEQKSSNLPCLQVLTFKNGRIGMFVPVLTATFSSTLFWASRLAGREAGPAAWTGYTGKRAVVSQLSAVLCWKGWFCSVCQFCLNVSILFISYAKHTVCCSKTFRSYLNKQDFL